jgi:phage tail protein X
MAQITLQFPNGFWTVDKLLWDYFKREYPGLVEQTLTQNPGLAALGVFPPKGTKVVVTLPTSRTSTPARLITLWTNGT